MAGVRFERVTKTFGKVIATNDVSLTVADGEFIVLLGPSGCGKTTLLRGLAGLEKIDAGRILIGERDVTELPPGRRRIAMVFQNYAVFPHMTLYDNIAFGLKMQKESKATIKERVDSVAELVHIEDLLERYPAQISGGQRQRVALARAIATKADVLLMDEPLSNLDAKLREVMRTEIRRIQQTMGITTVYVTHDQSEAMTLSDRIVVMNRGKIEQVAPPREIYQRPASAFVADFIGRSNFLRGTVAAQESGALLVEVMGRRLRVPASATAAPLRPGDEARLLIRPEAVRIGPGGTFSGSVQRATYLGPVVEYDVALGDSVINVLDADPLRATVYEPPSPVEVEFLDGCLYLLPSSDSN